MAKVPDRIWRGTVIKGNVVLDDAAHYAGLARRLEGKEIELILRKLRRKRSLDQNSYLWGVVYAIFAEELGYEVEELHLACRERFLRDRENEVAGLMKIGSTADLDTAQFTEYIEQVRRLAAEMGCVIPDPMSVEVRIGGPSPNWAR